MLRSALRSLAILSLFLAGDVANAASPIILGDSLGVGISLASGIKRLARNSVSIRNRWALEQIRQTPAGSIAILSLGINDALGPIKGLDKGIDAVVATAKQAEVTLVWLGPPCVHTSWDSNAQALDRYLAERLTSRGVRYVSARDDITCSPNMHARDGVHFTMAGYRHLWERARASAGLALEAAPAPPAQAAPIQLTSRAVN